MPTTFAIQGTDSTTTSLLQEDRRWYDVATQPSTQASMTALKIVSTISAISACSFSAAAYALMHQVVQSRHIHCQPAIVNNDCAAFSTSRRDAFAHASLLLVPAVVAIAAVPSDPANALEECGNKSHNCIRTTWRAPPPPSSTRAMRPRL
jgi:hypothetical protein